MNTTRQLVDEEGGTLRRRVCHGCGHRFYSLQQPQRLIPDWAIQWFHDQPAIDRDALTRMETQR